MPKALEYEATLTIVRCHKKEIVYMPDRTFGPDSFFFGDISSEIFSVGV